MIRGITVLLTVRTPDGTDELNVPAYTEAEEAVEDVLAAPSTDQEIAETLALTGKRTVYTLHIPKGDAHDWTNTKVAFFGQTFRTIGAGVEYIEANVPGRWNRKVMVERIGV